MSDQSIRSARHARHLALPEIGASGQERLANARVLIVGAGGLGSPAALYLAAAGVGTIGLVDGDRVELSNLQRQILYTTADLESPKVLAGAARLRALDPALRIEAHPFDVDAANVAALIAGYDVVIDGSDRLSTRYIVNDACVLGGKPLVTAAIHRFEGQAMTHVPDKGPCYRCLFPSNAEGLVANCAEAGVMGVLPGVLGTLQATEAIKLIVGIGSPLIGRLLVFDALAMEFREFAFARRRDCAVCGDAPTIRAPGADGSKSVARIGARELAAWLAASDREPPLLIDVRSSAEFSAGHLAGSLHLPLERVPRELATLPATRTLLFICRSGGRSANAAATAVAAGRTDARDLDGGLLAWRRDIDPRLEVADP